MQRKNIDTYIVEQHVAHCQKLKKQWFDYLVAKLPKEAFECSREGEERRIKQKHLFWLEKQRDLIYIALLEGRRKDGPPP